jgi:hypothetical protein
MKTHKKIFLAGRISMGREILETMLALLAKELQEVKNEKGRHQNMEGNTPRKRKP